MIPSTMRVLLCATPINMGRSFDSLAALVIERLDEDPTRADTMFVFVNAARDKIKLLWRDHNGVCILYKRWDDDVASLPEIADGSTHVTMDRSALARLLAGTPATTASQVEPTAKQVAHTAKAAAKKWMQQKQNQER
jgi:transposase